MLSHFSRISLAVLACLSEERSAQILALVNLGFGWLQFKTKSIKRESFVNRKRKLHDAYFDKIRSLVKIGKVFEP